MMAGRLKRLIPVGWKGTTRALVGLLAARHVFEATEAQRDEIAGRADALLASAPPDESKARLLKFDLASGDWRTRADAAARLSEDGAWTPWTVVGSLAAPSAGDPPRSDARLASAILVAARETLVPRLAERHARLRGSARAALAHEQDGTRHWDEAARPAVAEFARNARLHGASRRTAALQAIAAAAHLKGSGMKVPPAAAPFRLGAAASSLLRADAERERGGASAMKALARDVARLNDVREGMWDDAAPATTRLLGAAAAFAAFGRGTVSPPEPQVRLGSHLRAQLPVGELENLARLTAADAAAALEDRAADPRLDAARRRRLETVADALRRHPSSHAVSCADAAGLEAPEPRVAALRSGMKVYRAAAHGRHRAVVHEGKHGRPVRCRAIADADGALVGHLAFDALSREFGGRPLYAAYALDGSRYGYAWADERPVIRRGEPEQGFRTAPETIGD